MQKITGLPTDNAIVLFRLLAFGNWFVAKTCRYYLILTFIEAFFASSRQPLAFFLAAIGFQPASLSDAAPCRIIYTILFYLLFKLHVRIL